MRPARLLTTDGEHADRCPKNGEVFTLTELQEAVGGYIEVVRCARPQTGLLVVDEDGRLKGLAVNHAASELAGQLIVGAALHLPNRRMLG